MLQAKSRRCPGLSTAQVLKSAQRTEDAPRPDATATPCTPWSPPFTNATSGAPAEPTAAAGPDRSLLSRPGAVRTVAVHGQVLLHLRLGVRRGLGDQSDRADTVVVPQVHQLHALRRAAVP